MTEDLVVVSELPDGLTIVSTLSHRTKHVVYQVRDGGAILAELASLAAVFDYLNARD